MERVTGKLGGRRKNERIGSNGKKGQEIGIKG